MYSKRFFISTLNIMETMFSAFPTNNDHNYCSKTSALTSVGNRNNGHNLLLNARAEINVIPPSLKHRRATGLYEIQTKNESKIDTYVEKSLTLELDIIRNFRGTNFLTKFKLFMDIKSRKLIYKHHHRYYKDCWLAHRLETYTFEFADSEV